MKPNFANFSYLILILLKCDVLLAVVPHISQLEALKDFSNILTQDGELYWNYSSSNDCTNYEGLECDDNGMITSLSLTSINLYGYLPESIGNLSSLQSIYLFNNNFNGSIPSSIGALKNLSTLSIGSNQFTESLPKSISNLTSLTFIDLSNNNFSGNIPSDIGKLNKLTYLYMEQNSFSGEIPSSIHNLTLLSTLNFGDNQFYGKLPSNLSKLTNLEELLIYKNQLTGELPSELSKLPNIKTLVLGGNYFSGVIPVTLSQLPYSSHYNISFLFDDIFESNYYGFSQNCLTYPEDWPFTKEKQKSSTECAAFCNSNSTFGSCSGNGICLFNNSIPTCICDNGYKQGNNSLTCISEIASPPPPSPPPSSPSPPSSSPNSPSSDTKSSSKLGIIIGIIAAVILIIIVTVIVLFLIFCKERIKKGDTDESTSAQGKFQSLPVKEFRKEIKKLAVKSFQLKEIQNATNGFHENLTLGSGGFGTVYKGTLANGEICAIKRAHYTSVRSLHDFQQEVFTLAQASHSHIVKLIGYCDQANENILVYEFVEKGSLSKLLRLDNDHPNFLTFERRLQIAKDSAQGLNYLHNFLSTPLIHRDVKSDNILVDDKFHAKIADFGLLKSNTENLTAIKTNPCGTPGYLDPEYFKTLKVTSKSDVYSFGVVLLELVSGKPSILMIDDPEAPDGKLNQSLVSWALPLIQSNTMDELVDPNLLSTAGDQELDALLSLANLAAACLRGKQIERPGMDEVATRLGMIQYDSTFTGTRDEAVMGHQNGNYHQSKQGNNDMSPRTDSDYGVPFLPNANMSSESGSISNRSPIMSKSFKGR